MIRGLTVTAIVFGSSILFKPVPSYADPSNSVWDKIQASGEVVCGSMSSFAPNSWKVAGPSQYEGTAINFCREIVKDLSGVMNKKIEIKYVETTWGTVVLDIQSGRIDLFVGLNDSEERRRAVNLAGPAYELPDCIATKKGFSGHKTWKEFDDANITLSALAGSNSERTIKEMTPKARGLSFKQQSEAVLAVQSGRADGFVVSVLVCPQVQAANPDAFGGFILPQPLRSTPSNAGSRKDADGKFHNWLQQWVTTSRETKRTRAFMIDGLVKSGLPESAFPPELTF